MSSPNPISRMVLVTGMSLTVMFTAGCMKPMANGQTVIDPSQDDGSTPEEAYNPDVLKPQWREQMSPQPEVDLSEMVPDRRQRPQAQPRRQDDPPAPVLEDQVVPPEPRSAEPAINIEIPSGTIPYPTDDGKTVTPAPAQVPSTTTPREFKPIPAPRRQGTVINPKPAPAVTAATGVTAPTAVPAATGVSDLSGQRRFQTIPRPTETEPRPAPTGRRTDKESRPAPVVASTGNRVTAPSGVAAATGVTVSPKSVETAPTGVMVPTKPKAVTASTAPTATTGSLKGRTRMPERIPVPTRRETTPAKKVDQSDGTTPKAKTPVTRDEGYSVRAADNRDITETGTITPTIYFVAVLDEDKESCADKVGMHLTNGRVAMNVCRRSASFCSEQGSCLIKKGGKWHTFNVIRRVNGVDQYKLIDDGCVYGYGVRNSCLDPFYTVAADLSIYDPGDVVFIPKLRGLKLPNGSRHDGYLIVRDQGRGVKGRGRFDFFSGSASWGDGKNPFVKARLNDKDTDMTYHKVAGELAARVRQKRAYPKLPTRGAVEMSLNQTNTKGVPTSHLAQPGQDVMAGNGGDERPRF